MDRFIQVSFIQVIFVKSKISVEFVRCESLKFSSYSLTLFKLL